MKGKKQRQSTHGPEVPAPGVLGLMEGDLDLLQTQFLPVVRAGCASQRQQQHVQRVTVHGPELAANAFPVVVAQLKQGPRSPLPLLCCRGFLGDNRGFQGDNRGFRTVTEGFSVPAECSWVTTEVSWVTTEGSWVTTEGSWVTREGSWVTAESSRLPQRVPGCQSPQLFS